MQGYGNSAVWIGERLDDVDETGADLKRPAFWRLVGLIIGHQIDAVVIYRLDRLTRSLRDGVIIFDKLQSNNVKLFIVTAPEVGTAATDRFVLNLMASFAEFEREMIGSRFFETRAYLRRHGRQFAGKVPYGYDADPHTKQLAVNSEETPHVAEMFRMAAEGMVPRDIASIANNHGWRTKRYITCRTGRESGGGLWTPRQVLTLLANAVYLSRFAYEEGTRPGTHPAIVSEELFEQASQQIAARKVGKKLKASTTRQPTFWSLRGKVLCPECGRAMSTHVTQKGNVGIRYFRCRSFAGGRPPCKGKSFPAYDLERMVSDSVGKMQFPASPSDSTTIDRETFRRFQQKWGTLDEVARDQLLPKVVHRISFDQNRSKLRIETDDAAIIAFVDG